ncbi:HNH endonuclease [Shimia litoralis]|uniref:HNH endonuclease n=1 Tax=Shimia litoralis TaxID=420403 RepID=UPI003CCC4D82
MTDIREPALLRASHAKPWRDCEADVERLDVHNGLLLSALWDAAFDKGMITFSEEGDVVCSKTLGNAARRNLLENAASKVELTVEHQTYMHWHRRHIFQ